MVVGFIFKLHRKSVAHLELELKVLKAHCSESNGGYGKKGNDFEGNRNRGIRHLGKDWQLTLWKRRYEALGL